MKHLISSIMALILMFILLVDIGMDFGLRPVFASLISFFMGVALYSNIKE